jgi:hypothetical protein
VVGVLIILFLTLLMAMPSVGHAAHHKRHVHQKTPQNATRDTSITVWVNTNSGIYHYPGQRWYGNTAEGQYMTENAAVKAGYWATHNGQ